MNSVMQIVMQRGWMCCVGRTVVEVVEVFLPRKVLEMNSDTWFPDRLISDRCVNSRFNILLNCNRERGRGGRRNMQSVSIEGKPGGRINGMALCGKSSGSQSCFAAAENVFITT